MSQTTKAWNVRTHWEEGWNNTRGILTLTLRSTCWFHTFPQSGSRQTCRIGHDPGFIREGNELEGHNLPKIITLLRGRAGPEPCFWLLLFPFLWPLFISISAWKLQQITRLHRPVLHKTAVHFTDICWVPVMCWALFLLQESVSRTHQAPAPWGLHRRSGDRC